jgi:hypothetical protein
VTLHRCADTACPHVGQATNKGCACHKTDEQVLSGQRDAWCDLALRAIDCLHDVERETSWGQPTFGPSVWESLRDEQNDLLSAQVAS